MRTHQRLNVPSILGLLIVCSACNRAPAAEAEKPRFTTDQRGETLRSHTETGKVTRIKPQPARSKAPAKRTSDARENSGSIDTVADTPVTIPPPSTSITELSRAIANLSGGAGCGPDARRAFVVLKDTDAFVKANGSSSLLATIGAGTRVKGIAAEGDWRLVRFADAVWGERAGYIRCSVLELAPPGNSVSTRPDSAPTNVVVPVRTERPPDLTVDPRQKREILRGYLEWQKGTYIVVDGQRVRWTSGTRLQLGPLPFISSVPAGYEMVVAGRRARDGSVIAEQIEARPNTVVLYESEIARQLDDVERAWLANGAVLLPNGKELTNIGRIEDAGPAADRVRRIMRRIIPPYVDATHVRVHVVESDEWNARAMANGAVWVNAGLLNDTSDDELAVVLGHELAHYTHEHSRRSMKNDMWRQLAGVGATAVVSAASSSAARQVITTAARLSLLAWGNDYSRNLEDQADRVGLRYAYEGGFNVERAVDLWSRVRARFGEHDVVTNWFAGDHSRPTDRMKNLRRELDWNYRP